MILAVEPPDTSAEPESAVPPTAGAERPPPTAEWAANLPSVPALLEAVAPVAAAQVALFPRTEPVVAQLSAQDLCAAANTDTVVPERLIVVKQT